MSEAPYTFTVGEFEGPLDLLLDLIESHKLHISDVSLASITEEYMQFVRSLNELPAGQVAHFVLVASTLLLIKSRSLLPHLAFTREEETDMEDLERRLKFLERMRGLSRHIYSGFGKQTMRQTGLERKRAVVFAPSRDLSQTSLREAMRRTVANLPAPEKLAHTVVEKVISLEEMMGRLAKRVEQAFSTSFREFSKAHSGEKKSVIVGFLALLELMKQGVLIATQYRHFDDIQIEKDKIGIPEYN